jgi:site-specific DNA-methyltransferase (adenine-specific)
MITITETLYKKMPDDIKACFNQLPNPSSEEVRECFPETKSGKMGKQHTRHTNGSPNGIYGKFDINHELGETYGDSGNASRFFKSIIYQAKASKAERNKGCEGLEEKRGGSMEANTTDKMQLGGASLKGEPKKIQSTKNNHPTVKPIALMEYLIKMITPKGGTVLDPFMGSGSTGVAAIQNDFDFIGIDMTPEYIEIAKARINHAKKIKDNKLF